MKQKKAVPELISSLKDEDSDIREVAAYALGKIKDPRAVEPLISLLEDEDYRVRNAAAEALSKITGQKFGKNQKNGRSGGRRTRQNIQNSKIFELFSRQNKCRSRIQPLAVSQ